MPLFTSKVGVAICKGERVVKKNFDTKPAPSRAGSNLMQTQPQMAIVTIKSSLITAVHCHSLKFQSNWKFLTHEILSSSFESLKIRESEPNLPTRATFTIGHNTRINSVIHIPWKNRISQCKGQVFKPTARFRFQAYRAAILDCRLTGWSGFTAITWWK